MYAYIIYLLVVYIYDYVRAKASFVNTAIVQIILGHNGIPVAQHNWAPTYCWHSAGVQKAWKFVETLYKFDKNYGKLAQGTAVVVEK